MCASCRQTQHRRKPFGNIRHPPSGKTRDSSRGSMEKYRTVARTCSTYLRTPRRIHAIPCKYWCNSGPPSRAASRPRTHRSRRALLLYEAGHPPSPTDKRPARSVCVRDAPNRLMRDVKHRAMPHVFCHSRCYAPPPTVHSTAPGVKLPRPLCSDMFSVAKALPCSLSETKLSFTKLGRWSCPKTRPRHTHTHISIAMRFMCLCLMKFRCQTHIWSRPRPPFPAQGS